MTINVVVPSGVLAKTLQTWPGKLCKISPEATKAIHLAGIADISLRSDDSHGRNVIQMRTYEDLVARSNTVTNPYTGEYAATVSGADNRLWIQSFSSAVHHRNPLIDTDPLSKVSIAASAAPHVAKALGGWAPTATTINTAARFLRGEPGLGSRRAHMPINVLGRTIAIVEPEITIWPKPNLTEDAETEHERRHASMSAAIQHLKDRLTPALAALNLTQYENHLVFTEFVARSKRALIALTDNRPETVDVSFREIAYDQGATQFAWDVIERRRR